MIRVSEQFSIYCMSYCVVYLENRQIFQKRAILKMYFNRFQNRRYKTKRKQLQHELLIQAGSAALQMLPPNTSPSSPGTLTSSSSGRKVAVKVLMKDDQLMYTPEDINFLKPALYPGPISNYGYIYPPWIFGCSQ